MECHPWIWYRGGKELISLDFTWFGFNEHYFSWYDVMCYDMMRCAVMRCAVMRCAVMCCDMIYVYRPILVLNQLYSTLPYSALLCSTLLCKSFFFCVVGKVQENPVSPLDKVPRHLRSRLIFIKQELVEKSIREDERYFNVFWDL